MGRWRRPCRRRLALQMDDDASQAAGIAALGPRDAASAAVRGFETVSGSQIRRHGLRRRRERVQTEDPRHWRRLWAPRAPQPQHQGGHGREGVAIDLPQVDCSTCPTTRAEHVEPGRFCDQRSSDRWRPQHVAACGQLIILALDDALRLGARGMWCEHQKQRPA
jgi:hypothetical protein